ncbi:MAG TPA: winged helix-turn-helix transcriptional regulator [Candidatus Thermoplasmatota archaeon]|nr:winged helix-turn-helix transcriptional regulator [Candidatus Thermoplasmatota archaeon]
MHDDVLSVASRRRIYECVTLHPGAHLRDISRRAGLPLGTTLYHLDHLESHGLVHARRDGRYKRYFGTTGMGRREKDLLSVLRHDAPRRIVEALLAHGASTQRGLCAALGLSRSTLSFHLNVLVERGIARREPTRPEGTYLIEDAALASDLLARYGQSLSSPSVTLVPSAPEAAPGQAAIAG